MDEIIDMVVEATPTPAPDYSELISRLDTLIDINMSIYAWITFFIVIAVGGWVVYQMLRPLIYFLR